MAKRKQLTSPRYTCKVYSHQPVNTETDEEAGGFYPEPSTDNQLNLEFGILTVNESMSIAVSHCLCGLSLRWSVDV